MAKEQSVEGGAPEWMVSYADMITIVMAFFVVLYASVGTNSLKDQEGKQAAVANTDNPANNYGKYVGGNTNDERMREIFDSLYRRFGPDWTISNCWTGGTTNQRPRLRPGTGNSFDPDKKPPPPDVRGHARDTAVTMLAPKQGDNVVAGGRIYFLKESVDLLPEQFKQIQAVAHEMGGKLQKLEVRGHASLQPLSPDSPFKDHFELAYARCRKVQEVLIKEGIDPRRLRLGVSGQNDPLHLDGDALKMRQNSRVEIRLLSEWVQDPSPQGGKDAKPGHATVGKPRS